MLRALGGRGLARIGLVWLTLLGSHAMWPQSTALAEDKAALAKQEFMSGVEAFEAGRHTTALAHFQEAYRLKPHPLVRVNIANCYVRLGKPIEAVFHFKKFLASDEGEASQRSEIEAEIESLMKKVGAVQLLISPDGAQVQVDDGDRRTAPIMEAIQLAEGHHKVVVSLHGYQAYEGDFRVKGGKTIDVDIRLKRGADSAPPVAAPAPVPADEPVEEAPLEEPLEEEAPPEEEPIVDDSYEASGSGGGLSTPTIIAMAATGAALVTGITLGVLFQSADEDFKANAAIANDTTQDPARRQDAWRLGRDALETSQTLAAFADIMFVTAAIGVGVSGYLLLEDLAAGEHAARPGTRLSASVGPGHAGLRLHHSF